MKPYQVEMPSLNFRKLSENHPPFQMDEIICIIINLKVYLILRALLNNVTLKMKKIKFKP